MPFPALTSALKNYVERNDPKSLFSAPELKDMVFSTGAEWYERNGFRNIAAELGGGASSWSGESVSINTAQTHSVVWACKRIISETVGWLPLSLMQETDKGKFQAKNHPIQECVHNEPNPDMSAMGYQETMTGHVVLGGNAFSQIFRRSGTGVAMELGPPLMPSQVRRDRDKQKRLIYLVKEGNSPEQTFTVERNKPHDLLHIPGIGDDGIWGSSVITIARQSIGSAIATERHNGRFLARGGRLPYLLSLDKKFQNDADADKFRADWKKVYDNPHETPILEPWLKYEAIGVSAKDAQFLESRLFNVPEVCRWFLISPHMVEDLSHATFSNIENLMLQFVKMTLTAWLTRWEQSLRRCVLTPAEKGQGYFFRHNLNAILRGDFAGRMAGYSSMLQNGYKNIDEVRDLEDDNPLPNGAGQAYHIQMNQATVPGTGQPMVAEQGILARMAQQPKAPAIAPAA